MSRSLTCSNVINLFSAGYAGSNMHTNIACPSDIQCNEIKHQCQKSRNDHMQTSDDQL